MVKTIYLIRHCEPHVQAGKKGSLTEKGRQQAYELAMTLAPELQHLPNKIILHAPVARCQETAEILGEKLEIPIIQAPLRLEGADKLALKGAQSKMSQYLASYKEKIIESPDEYGIRIVGHIHKQPAGTVVIVGNEVPLRLLLRYITGNDKTAKPTHASCTKITLVKNSSFETRKIH